MTFGFLHDQLRTILKVNKLWDVVRSAPAPARRLRITAASGEGFRHHLDLRQRPGQDRQADGHDDVIVQPIAELADTIKACITVGIIATPAQEARPCPHHGRCRPRPFELPITLAVPNNVRSVHRSVVGLQRMTYYSS